MMISSSRQIRSYAGAPADAKLLAASCAKPTRPVAQDIEHDYFFSHRWAAMPAAKDDYISNGM
jgi:hypothetical protein